MPTVASAQHKVDVIDMRIDAVRADLCRVSGLDPKAFDYDTKEGQLAACRAWDVARRVYPGFGGIELSLFRRRTNATYIRNNLIWKDARAAEVA